MPEQNQKGTQHTEITRGLRTESSRSLGSLRIVIIIVPGGVRKKTEHTGTTENHKIRHKLRKAFPIIDAFFDCGCDRIKQDPESEGKQTLF